MFRLNLPLSWVPVLRLSPPEGCCVISLSLNVSSYFASPPYCLHFNFPYSPCTADNLWATRLYVVAFPYWAGWSAGPQSITWFVAAHYLQPHSFSRFGKENNDFMQLKGVSPGMHLLQQAVATMTAGPSTLQEASPWMNPILWIGNFPPLAQSAGIQDSLSCW